MPAPSRSRPWSGDDFADDDEEHPPWAGPGITPRWADHEERERRRLRDRESDGAGQARPGRRPPRQERPGAAAGRTGAAAGRTGAAGARFRGRLAAAKARRLKRTRSVWLGAAVVALAIGGAVGYEVARQPSPQPPANGLVTTYLPGEFRTVPQACSAVAPGTLGQYLPGKRRVVRPRSLYGRAQSLCDWSVDKAPLYRVLQVTVRAYPPSGLAGGNGSATFAAQDAYRSALQRKAKPPKATHLPKATVSRIGGLGSAAASALQVVRVGGVTNDLLTVLVRDHNVLITVQFQGSAPVTPARLRAGALAAARDILARLR